MTRRIVAALTVALLALGISAAGAQPAAATEERAAACCCSTAEGYIEGWDGTNTCATISWSYWWSYLAVGQCKNVYPANTVSYIWNNTNERWNAYTGAGCTGSVGPLYANTAGPMTGSWNNNIESIKRME